MDTLGTYYGSSSSEEDVDVGGQRACHESTAPSGDKAGAASTAVGAGWCGGNNDYARRKRPRPTNGSGSGGGGDNSYRTGATPPANTSATTPSLTASSVSGGSQHQQHRKTTKDFTRILPPPPLTVGTNHDGDETAKATGSSMVSWSKDYITQRHLAAAATIEGVLRAAAPQSSFVEATTAAGGLPLLSCSVADRLRSDPNFTNPHQFGAAMEELGIVEALGSNLIAVNEDAGRCEDAVGRDYGDDDDDDEDDWEYTDLERLEIEARRRKQEEELQAQQPGNHQQQHPLHLQLPDETSQFAQEQLQRALQRQNPQR